MSLTLLVTIGIALLAVAIAAGLTASSRRARPLVLGIGIAALVVGLYLTRVSDLIVDGVAGIIAWAQATPFDSAMAWGIGLAVGGLLAVIGGSFLPKRAKEPKPEGQPEAAPASVAGRQTPAVGAAKPEAQPKPKPAPKGAKGVDPEDAEIEALLRKRGIM